MFLLWCFCGHFLILTLAVPNCDCLPAEKGYLTCRDDKGVSVDWFIAYKPPKNDPGSGSSLLYMDSRNAKWRKLDSNVHQKDNPLAVTLDSIYKDRDSNNAYVMYSDDPPECPINNFGHTKGVINFNTKSGYWLVHSVPKFPPPKSYGNYSYIESGLKYGQIFLCLSIDYKYLDVLGQLFLYNHPQIYDHVLPEKFKKSNPNLTSAIEGRHLKTSDLSSCQFSSLGGQKFIGFAKCSEYNDDLWVGIAKSLKTGLEVQTWKNGRDKNLPSYCKGDYKVENIRNLSILNFTFSDTQDHAKWAVSNKKIPIKDAVAIVQSDSPSWMCVGDINRQLHQKKRGGGAVCFNHQAAVGNFQQCVSDVEEC